jgi:ABC-type lipoprotein release transport system permease subunit
MNRLQLVPFWGKIAFLFLSRSLRSTGILSLMLVTAVAALIFLSALAMGVNDAMVRNSVSLYSGHITGAEIPEAVTRAALNVPGVTAVLKRNEIPGLLTRGDKIHEVLVTQVEPDRESGVTAISRKVVSGKYLTAKPGQLLIGLALAEKLKVKPGDKIDFISAGGKTRITLSISGVYRTGIDQLDGVVAFCPSGTLPAVESAWTAAVFLKEGTAPDAVMALYRQNKSLTGIDFKSWETLMPDLKQLIDLNYVSMSIVIILVFAVVSLGIACAFVIVILKTLREYGVLKAMGVTAGETALLIVFEVVLMNLFASALGILVGIALTTMVGKTGIDLTAFTSHNRYFAVSGVIYPRLTPFSWGAPPALAFLFSLVAAIWPAILVSRRRAAEILRMV